MEPVRKLSRSIAGKVALVTGAASGMGRATAHIFAGEGAKVAVLDLKQDRVDAVVAEIKAEGGEAEGWALDVADGDGIIRVVKEVEARFGSVSVWRNRPRVKSFYDCRDPD
jgi:3-oxoacyl-[acyl-carrier protein] reductase